MNWKFINYFIIENNLALVGFKIPSTIENIVVLPAPFGPSKATISWVFTVTLTSLRMTLFLIIFVK